MPAANLRTASLSLQSVSKHFGQVRAVDGVDLDIKQDEFFNLIAGGDADGALDS